MLGNRIARAFLETNKGIHVNAIATPEVEGNANIAPQLESIVIASLTWPPACFMGSLGREAKGLHSCLSPWLYALPACVAGTSLCLVPFLAVVTKMKSYDDLNAGRALCLQRTFKENKSLVSETSNQCFIYSKRTSSGPFQTGLTLPLGGSDDYKGLHENIK